jgi:hypothetical protein
VSNANFLGCSYFYFSVTENGSRRLQPEYLYIPQTSFGRGGTADPAIRILSHLDSIDFHRRQINAEENSFNSAFHTQQPSEGYVGLQAAENSGGGSADGNWTVAFEAFDVKKTGQTWGGWRADQHHLAVEFPYPGVDEGYRPLHAEFIYNQARLRIIQAIDDEIAITENIGDIPGIDRLVMRNHLDFGIESLQAPCGSQHLGFSGIFGGIEHLAIQVRYLQVLIIADRQSANTGSGKIYRRRRAQSTGSGDTDMAALQLLLTVISPAVYDNLAFVSLVAVHRSILYPAGPYCHGKLVI